MANAIPILTYHSLHGSSADYEHNDHIALAVDLDTISALGFQIAALTDVARYITGTGAPWLDEGRWVALTFDDGADWDYFDLDDDDLGYVKSFYTMLREHFEGQRVREPLAVSFVIASPEARAVLDRRCIAGMNNWQDVWWKAASDSGILGIGNHSWDHVHPALPEYAQDEGDLDGWFHRVNTAEAANRQIRDAENYIRERLGGRSIGLFAYPYGQASRYVVSNYFPRFAQDLGITAAFATWGDYATRGSHRWNVPRFVKGQHWQSPEELQRILTHAIRPIQATLGTAKEANIDLTSVPIAIDNINAEVLEPSERSDNEPTVIGATPLAPVLVRHSIGVLRNAGSSVRFTAPAPALPFDTLICLEEISEPQFFASNLFRQHFRSEVPTYGTHFIAFCRGEREERRVIGYMHALTRDEVVFCGGIVVDEHERRSLPTHQRRLTRGAEGVMDAMLRSFVKRASGAPAIWSYVGDAVIEGAMSRAGFVRTKHAYLMVSWNAQLAENDRAERLEKVATMGPF